MGLFSLEKGRPRRDSCHNVRKYLMVTVKVTESQWKGLKQWPQIETSDFENIETKRDTTLNNLH